MRESIVRWLTDFTCSEIEPSNECWAALFAFPASRGEPPRARSSIDATGFLGVGHPLEQNRRKIQRALLSRPPIA